MAKLIIDSRSRLSEVEGEFGFILTRPGLRRSRAMRVQCACAPLPIRVDQCLRQVSRGRGLWVYSCKREWSSLQLSLGYHDSR